MNVFTPLAIRLGAIPWLPRFLKQITAIDKFLQKISGGRFGLLRMAGLPYLMLTVVGRKSGRVLETPLLCVPYGEGNLIAGSNWGGLKMPMWVLNVRAAQERARPVGVNREGNNREAQVRELSGEDRALAWKHMVKTWPNYQLYADRTDRTIPVFYLDPVA